MKSSLKAGLSFSKSLLVDEARCIGFMGKEGMVYATPKMVRPMRVLLRVRFRAARVARFIVRDPGS